MSYHRCVRCASDRMMDGAFVSDMHGERVVVGVEHHPERGPLANPVSTGVHASICGACGFVELWANRPEELYEAYYRAELRRPKPRRVSTPGD